MGLILLPERRHPVAAPSTTILLTAVLFLILGYAPPAAYADCECGYLAIINGSGTSSDHHHHRALFTDLLETNFARRAAAAASAGETGLPNNALWEEEKEKREAGWVRQAFNLTREQARGEYGEMFAVENNAEAAEETLGLQLVVRAGDDEVIDGMVPVAELDTRRLDLMWGTFRAMMKVSPVKGTCAAFFWYFNDTQEIDMEFLSKDFNASNRSYPINLVLQSREAAMAGYDASATGNFVRVFLPFDPTEDFHEYRIDYLPGRVFFFADGEVLAEMDGPAVPSSPGHLVLRHWSNGNKYWSGGPPTEDASLVVSYVKAYFNSSTAQRQRDWEARCPDPTASNAVCEIPDVTPVNRSAAAWFFSDHANMTNNQTVSEQSKASRSTEVWSSIMGWLLLVGGYAIAL
ncbi:concanavalin A-like lectin/glucanase domain-containing protein [Corynascus similis CBS 632.67]